jgi:hypothetical protein
MEIERDRYRVIWRIYEILFIRSYEQIIQLYLSIFLRFICVIFNVQYPGLCEELLPGDQIYVIYSPIFSDLCRSRTDSCAETDSEYRRPHY